MCTRLVNLVQKFLKVHACVFIKSLKIRLLEKVELLIKEIVCLNHNKNLMFLLTEINIINLHERKRIAGQVNLSLLLGQCLE